MDWENTLECVRDCEPLMEDKLKTLVDFTQESSRQLRTMPAVDKPRENVDSLVWTVESTFSRGLSTAGIVRSWRLDSWVKSTRVFSLSSISGSQSLTHSKVFSQSICFTASAQISDLRD